MRDLIARANTYERTPQFLALQKMVVQKNKDVQRVFPWIWGAIIGFTLFGAIVYFVDILAYTYWYEIGRYLGRVAAIVYALTLLPGMLRRIGAFPLVRTMLMLTRRQLGVTMFWCVFAHLSLVRYFPILFTGSNPFIAPVFVWFGMTAFTLLFPLWLTSNETSVKKLGAWWHTIHSLTYVALFAIFLHIALQGRSWTALFVGTVMVLEVFSWIFPYLFPVTKVGSPSAFVPTAPRVPETPIQR